jgi:hypothetical protein
MLLAEMLVCFALGGESSRAAKRLGTRTRMNQSLVLDISVAFGRFGIVEYLAAVVLGCKGTSSLFPPMYVLRMCLCF